MITVGFDNSTYQIKIFEESSGESIFSKGNDQDYIPKVPRPGLHAENLNDVSEQSPSLLAVPHSLGGAFRSPRGAFDSKSTNSNHDNSCRHDPLGQDTSQHVPNENAKPNPIDNTMVTGLKGSHLSPTACSSAKIFMAEGTTNLQRSKKSDHADTSSVALTPEDKIASTSTNSGPHSQQPTLPLDKNLAKPQKPKTKSSKPLNKATPAYHPSKSRPSSPRVICTQRTEIISKSKKKGPTKKSYKAPSKKGITHPNHSHANVEQIQAESLHDSNIANMNRIFLNNLSQVMATEI
ncbi:hypothetical protein Ancab_010236 [Ancistrocladus abbreviatus]